MNLDRISQLNNCKRQIKFVFVFLLSRIFFSSIRFESRPKPRIDYKL